MGNLGSVEQSLSFLKTRFITSNNPDELALADAYILPGVGAFPSAMEHIREMGIEQLLQTEVLENNKPFLGICLGMQLLANDSQEQGFTRGLGWIDAHVMKLAPAQNLNVPHVGWNNISFKPNELMFSDINPDPHYYFDHSFHFVCKDENLIVSRCDYGGDIISAIRKGHIFATQFHPEKSQRNGLKLIRNFLTYLRLNPQSHILANKD